MLINEIRKLEDEYAEICILYNKHEKEPLFKEIRTTQNIIDEIQEEIAILYMLNPSEETLSNEKINLLRIKIQRKSDEIIDKKSKYTHWIPLLPLK